jgi:NTE family protein
VLADAANLLREGGIADGRYLRDWLGGVLGDLGVRTFADLRLTGEAAQGLPPDRRWALVVTATDVSRRRGALLPWDYPRYGRDPDAQPVVDAVAASAALPAVVRPVHLRVPGGADATFLDGGLLSNYPVTVFDRRDGQAPRWPTFGVRLTTAEESAARPRRIRSAFSLVPAVLRTMLEATEARLVEDPCVLERTITVDTGAIRPTDFELSPAQREALRTAGERAARAFLSGWDWDRHRRRCRGTG